MATEGEGEVANFKYANLAYFVNYVNPLDRLSFSCYFYSRFFHFPFQFHFLLLYTVIFSRSKSILLSQMHIWACLSNICLPLPFFSALPKLSPLVSFLSDCHG